MRRALSVDVDLPRATRENKTPGADGALPRATEAGAPRSSKTRGGRGEDMFSQAEAWER